MNNIPELLCPAGDRRAAEAAVQYGANAIYLGGRLLNARMNAANFSDDDMRSVIHDCHLYNVKVYVTVNTLCRDRELSEALEYCAFLYGAGADAVIMADPGLCALCRKALPSLELHASTQACGHGLYEAEFFASRGFSRAVLSRELDFDDIRTISERSPIETELFVHGAHCVSVSGQCLCSFAMGGRSGNRGECAQPCRKSYAAGDGKPSFPLSLKDMCLAGHITDILDTSVASLKIEGRMKSAEYVGGVTRIYRSLLDERRNATSDEMRELEALFSRSGFTDGYFTHRYSDMGGVRSDADKEKSRSLEPFGGLTRRVPLKLSAKIHAGVPVSLTLSACTKTVTAEGEPPLEAINAPTTPDSAAKNLCRFGGSVFEVACADIDVGNGVMVPAGRLNSLRRDAVAALEAAVLPVREYIEVKYDPKPPLPDSSAKKLKIAEFLSKEQITHTAAGYFDIAALPLFSWSDKAKANAVSLPPAVLPREYGMFLHLLDSVKGAKYAVVQNPAHIPLVLSRGLIPVGGTGLNVYNSVSAARLFEAGCFTATASPELNIASMAALSGDFRIAATVYGRLPLMHLTRCVIAGERCPDYCKDDAPLKFKTTLTDTTGAVMPLFCSFGHRNVLYNSVPVYMADRLGEVVGMSEHYLFTDETPGAVDGVITAYKRKLSPTGMIRRLK